MVKDHEGLGSTTKNMKKLTTVFSKNQKLHSMNIPAPAGFTTKVNLENEIARQEKRLAHAAREKFIEENLPVLEAIQEAR